MKENIILIVLSFFASLGFGIVFQIPKKELIYAGIGGAITRIAYILFMAFIPYRIIYAALAAFVASVYTEAVAEKKKMPATVFLYPAIIPLIPGDLLYYTIGGLIVWNKSMFFTYLIDCSLSLVGISVGFVVCSSCVHFVKKQKIKMVESHS